MLRMSADLAAGARVTANRISQQWLLNRSAKKPPNKEIKYLKTRAIRTSRQQTAKGSKIGHKKGWTASAI
tara:strand:+ start:488 stop:697 length:210 start_codon:yes stop_codon:yes gene_type:complete